MSNKKTRHKTIFGTNNGHNMCVNELYVTFKREYVVCLELKVFFELNMNNNIRVE